MKKLVWISFMVLMLASACTTYTCPTYADAEVEDTSSEKVEDTI